MGLRFFNKKLGTMSLEQAMEILQADAEYTRLELKNSLFDRYAWSYIWAVRLVISNLESLGELELVNLKQEHELPIGL